MKRSEPASAIAMSCLWNYPPCTMNITLPAPLEASLTERRAALHLAIGLFTAEEATLGQAAEAAGMSQGEFMRELARRKIPMHYGVEELAEDLVTIRELQARRTS
jgi:predicted HTH domain antitoxin